MSARSDDRWLLETPTAEIFEGHMRPTAGSDAPDDELVRAARDGDEVAFEALLRRHESRVLRVLGLLGISAADREDVAQEVFVRVFRHLGGFRMGQTFAGWLYRISVNAAHDYRKRSHRHAVERTSPFEELDRVTGEEADAGELAERLDRRRRLEHAMTLLSDRERAVFVLCELEGLETRQVARALGISSITVRRHLSRSRRRLQRELEAD